jgi:hypothetical protein
MDTKMITFEAVRDKIELVRGEQVILDYAVAELYGVETREINQAVKNNPRKFPEGWMFEIDNQETAALRSKNLMLEKGSGRGKYSKHNYKAFEIKTHNQEKKNNFSILDESYHTI